MTTWSMFRVLNLPLPYRLLYRTRLCKAPLGYQISFSLKARLNYVFPGARGLPPALQKKISDKNGGHDEDPTPVYRYGSIFALRGRGSPTETAPARQRDLYGHGIRRQSGNFARRQADHFH